MLPAPGGTGGIAAGRIADATRPAFTFRYFFALEGGGAGDAAGLAVAVVGAGPL